jgi:hypothetical protein
MDSARASLADASREILESARNDLQERTHVAAEAAAKPAAETAARAVAEQLVRVTLAAVTEDAAQLRADVEQTSVTMAEQVAREMVQHAVDAAAAERQSAALAADEKLQLALAGVPATAERVAQESLELARAVMEDASRGVLDSVRAELQDSVRMVADAAAKPAAEAAARVVAEEVAQRALAVAHEEEAASRQRIEESAIAVAEQVGRDLVKLAFEAARTGRPAATSEEPVGQTYDVARSGVVEAVRIPPPAPSVPEPRPPAWSSRAVLLPWLVGLTAAVVYLAYKSFS